MAANLSKGEGLVTQLISVRALPVWDSVTMAPTASLQSHQPKNAQGKGTEGKVEDGTGTQYLVCDGHLGFGTKGKGSNCYLHGNVMPFWDYVKNRGQVKLRK